MKFPIIADIASTSVVSIDINSSVSDTINMMLKHEHRNVIVLDNECFKIFTVIDILNIKSQNIDLNTPLKELSLLAIPVISKYKNILDTMEYLNLSIEYICVLNENDSLYGLLTHTDIISNIDPETLMDNFRLQDFLKLGQKTERVEKQEKMSELFKKMLDKSFDNVVIVENTKPIGIFTTKDIMKLIKNNEDLELPISRYMSAPIETINKRASVKEALELIKKKHYKRVVVVDDNGNLSGIISQKELISLTYSRWAVLMKEYQEELSEINTILEKKNREYKELASTDSLTGLYNRNKFSELYLSFYQKFL